MSGDGLGGVDSWDKTAPLRTYKYSAILSVFVCSEEEMDVPANTTQH